MDKAALLKFVLCSAVSGALLLPPGVLPARAQQEGPQKPAQTQEGQKPQEQLPPQPVPPSQNPTGQNPQEQKPPQKQPQYAISVEAPLVNVDVVVTDQDGNIITGLKKENFRVLQDNVPQQITNFAPTDAPITVVMLLEFSNVFGPYVAYNAKYWAYDFMNHLNQQDWIALVTYDLKSHIEVDFTQNKAEVQDAVAHLYFPGFSEANEFDAVIDTVDRLKDVKGKKAILLITSGRDTFSKHTLGKTYDRLKQTDVTIFSVDVAENWLVRFGIDDVSYLQDKNELSTFSKLTGGYAWFPRFDGEIPGIYDSVAAFLRNQYSVGYAPSTPDDGKYHKIKVEVLGDDGQPLSIEGKKGKKKKVVVYAREGYQSAKAAVGD